MKFNLLLIVLVLFSCSKSSDIPVPKSPILAAQIQNPDAADDVASCEVLSFQFDYESESYQLGNNEEMPFGSEFSVWIPDEGEPTFYIITYNLVFCNFLFLNIEGFSYQLEEIGNPDGYWYEVTVSELAFQEILDGETIKGKLEINDNRNSNCLTQYFTGDLNSEVYDFGNGFVEFDDGFSMSADFFPIPQIEIYSKNRHLCAFLHLDLETYAYSLEQFPEPHYLVTLPFDDLVPLVNGESLYGRFEYQHRAIVAVDEVRVE